MNILMMTNTFTPHTGGVARSVESFTAEYRRLGHRVLVVAPVFEGMPSEEEDVVRVPAIQKFNGSDFSVRLPIPSFLFPELDRFRADIVHAHHPFLLGDTALCVAALKHAPLVFTHHTRYEQYTHYILGDSPALKRFVIELSTGFANLCDAVITPSETIAGLLRRRGVTPPIEVIPTGVDISRFARGDGPAFRASSAIPQEAFVVGHVGRLAPEKNLEFLARAVAEFLNGHSASHFLIAGVGPSHAAIERIFDQAGLAGRLHITGILSPAELANAYHAMDVFAFASQSETQGLVLTEAMAAGVPVVAIDAAGVREVVRDGQNGSLLPKEERHAFASALSRLAGLSGEQRARLHEGARKTAEQFSLERTAVKALELYQSVSRRGRRAASVDGSPWLSALQMIGAEWEIWVNRAQAARMALIDGVSNKGEQP
jgi:glycosyltransferase involved in cell wall biosynthesis